MDCGSCRYFQPRDVGDMQGQCRRHPPTVVQSGGPGVPWVRWPVVQAGDWCGEYEPHQDLKNMPVFADGHWNNGGSLGCGWCDLNLSTEPEGGNGTMTLSELEAHAAVCEKRPK